MTNTLNIDDGFELAGSGLYVPEKMQAGKSGILLRPQTRRSLRPTLPERILDGARRPILYGLTALTLGGAVLPPAVAKANDIVVENTITGKKGENCATDRTRISGSYGPVSVTFDRNYDSKKPNEVTAWADVLNRNGWYIGAIGELDNETKRDNSEDGQSADFGVSVARTFGKTKLGGFFLPIIEDGTKPVYYYNINVGDTTGTKKLTLHLFDDKSEKFSLGNVSTSLTGSIKAGNFLVGAGTNQDGFDINKYLGTVGYSDDNFGSLTVFKHDLGDKEFWFKMQNALGNPNGGFYSIGTPNIWNDMEGPGIRDVSTPYFSSFLTKGNLTNKFEGTITPNKKDLQAMIGKNLGFLRAGIGANYHREDGKVNAGLLLQAGRTFKFDDRTGLYLEGRYNTRGNDSKVYFKFNRAI